MSSHMTKKQSATRRRIARRTAMLAAVAMSALASVSRAATVTWTGSVNASWDGVSNWSGAAKPINTDDVIFPTPIPGTGGSIILSSGEVANTLTFNASYSLGSGNLNLRSGTVTVNNFASNATIASVLTGTSVLTKAGVGTLFLTGSNTYSGGTSITAGTLIAQSSGSLGNGTVTVGASGTLGIDSTMTVGNVVNNNSLTINAFRAVSLLTPSNTFTQAAGTLTVTGQLNLNGNTFTYNGGNVVGTVNMAGTPTLAIGASAGGGTFQFTGIGATVTGNTSAAMTLLINPSTGSTMNLNLPSTFTNNGTMTLAGATNEGVFVSMNGGTGSFTNVGTLNVNSGSSAAARTINGTFSNTGTTNINESAQFNNTSNSGAFTIAAGKTFSFGSAGNSFTQSAGTLTVNGAMSMNGNTFSYNGGNVVGTVTMGGSAVLALGASPGGGTFAFTGTNANVTGSIPAAMTLNIAPSTGSSMSVNLPTGFTNSGTIALSSAATESIFLSVNGGTGTFTNAGGLSINPGTGAAPRSISGTFVNNSGATVAMNDSMTFNSVTNNGAFTIASGKAFTLGSTSYSFTQSGGTLTVNGSMNLNGNTFNYNGGTIAGTSHIVMSGTSTLAIGAGAGAGTFDFIGSNASITGAGTNSSMTLNIAPSTGSSMNVILPTTFTNSGTIALSSATTEGIFVSVNGGTGTLTNAGTLTISPGTGVATRTINGTYINTAAGTTNVNENTTFNNVTNSGAFTIGAGKSFNLNSTSYSFTQSAGTLTVAGTMNLNGNTFNYSGGNVVGTVALAGTPTLALSGTPGGGTFKFTGSGATITGSGTTPTMTLNVQPSTGSSMNLNLPTTFTNSGTILLAGATSEGIFVSVNGGTGTLTNAGSLTIGPGSSLGTRTINGTYINTAAGTTNVNETSTFNNVTNSGAFTIAAGKTFNLNSTSYSFTQSAGTLTVNGSMNLNGNTFNYSGGNVVGSVNLSGTPTLALSGTPGGGTFIFNGSGATITGSGTTPTMTLNFTPSTGSSLNANFPAAFTNSGTISLGGATTEGDFVSVNGGTGTLTNAGTFSFVPGASLGTRTLNGTYINASGGVTNINETASFNNVTNNGAFTIAASKTFSFASTGYSFTQAAGTLTVNGSFAANGNTFNYSGGNVVGTVLLAGTPTLALSGTPGGGTFQFSGSGATVTGSGSPAAMTMLVRPASGSSMNLNLPATFTNSGAITLSSATTEGIFVSVNGGTGTLTNQGAFTINSGTAAASRTVNGTFANSASGTTNVNESTTFSQVQNSGVFNVAAGKVVSMSAGNAFQQLGGTSTLAGSAVLVASGSGTVGGLVMSGGIMALTGGGSPSSITLNGNMSGGGGALGATISSTVGGSSAATIALGTAPRTITVLDGAAAVDLTVGAKFTGTGAAGIVKAGPGTMLMSGFNTYTGTTTVSAGTLRVSGGNAIGDSAVVNITGGELAVDSSETVGQLVGSSSSSLVTLAAGASFVVAGTSSTFPGIIQGGGGLVRNGAGQTLGLAGTAANTFTGQTSVLAGTLFLGKTSGVNAIAGDVSVGSAGTIIWGANEQIADSSHLTLASGGTLNLNGFTETVYSFTDNGGTTILGGGQLLTAAGLTLTDGTNIAVDTTVSGDIAYTGVSTVATISGPLTLSGLAGTMHTITVNDGAADPDVIFSNTLTTAGSVTKLGAGTLQLSGSGSSIGSSLLLSAGTTRISGGSLTAQQISQGDGRLIIAGGTLSSSTSAILGSSSNDVIVDHTGGTLSAASVIMGNGAGAGATYNLSGTGAINSPSVMVGAFGHATLNQTGGSVTTAALAVAGAGGTSTYKLSGGTLSVTGSTVIGSAGIGSFIHSGGTFSTSADVSIGSQVGSNGSYLLSNTASLSITGAHALNVGGAGGGTFIIAGSTATVSGDVNVGTGNGIGQINVAAGTLAVGGTVNIGPVYASTNSGAGTVVQTGGAQNVSGSFYVGQGGASLNSLSISAGTLDVTNDIGVGVQGFVSQTGGAVATHAGSNVGFLGVSGAYTLDQSAGVATLSIAGKEYIDGNFTQSAGTNTAAMPVIIGKFGGPGPAYHLNGGTLNATGGVLIAGEGSSVNGAFTQIGGQQNVTGDMVVGNFGTGSFTQSGGVAAVSGNVLIGANSGASGTLTTSGGTLTASNFYLGGSASASGGSGSINVNTGGTLSTTGLVKVWDVPGVQLNLQGGTIVAAAIDTNGNPSRFNWSSGTLKLLSTFTVESGAPLGGAVSLEGGMTLNTADFFIGSNAAGSFTVDTGGVANSNAVGFVQLGGNSIGTASVTNGGVWNVAATQFRVGNSGNATLAVSTGGQVNSTADVAIARTAGTSSLTVADPNSVFVTTQSLYVGGDASAAGGSAALSVTNGGTLTVGGTLKVWSGAGKSFHVTAATVSANRLELAGGANTIDVGASMTIGSGGLSSSGGDLHLASGDGVSGALSVGGDVTYNGTTDEAFITTDTIAPGKMDLLAATRQFNIADGSNSVDMVIVANIVNGGINKTGAGTLYLSGQNTYTGPTIVSQGQLTVTNGSLASATAVSIGTSATLSVLGSNTIASLASSAGGTGSLQLGSFTILTVGDENSTSYNGTIAGSSSQLIKQGVGSLTLGGNVSGTTMTVNLGTLRLGAANAGLSGLVTVTGTGPTFGTLALPADNLGAASIALPGGHLVFENSMNLSRSITLGVGNGTLDVAGSSTVEINSVLSGAGGLTKAGSGTLGLDAANTYLGGTTIAAGTLATRVVNAIPTDSEVFVASGASLVFDSHNQSIASLAGAGTVNIGAATMSVGANDATTSFTGPINGTAAGALVKNGLGTLTLGGALNFSGGITVNAGALALTNTGAQPLGGGIIVHANAAVIIDGDGRLGPASNAVTLDGGTGTLQAISTFSSSNPIQIGTLGGTIDVASGQTLTQNGAVTGSTVLNKNGLGTLQFNSAQPLGGAILINKGKLLLASNGSMTSVTAATAITGGTFELDNSVVNNGNRFAGNLTLTGGAFKFDGAAAASSDAMGTLALGDGASSLVLQQGAGGSTSVSFSGLTQTAGATLDATIPGAITSTNQLMFPGHLAGPLGGWATVSGTDFAKYDATLGVLPFAPGDYSSSLPASGNVRLTSSTSTAGSFVLQTLSLDASGSAIAITGSNALTLQKGGLLKFGVNTATITGGSITNGGGGTSGGALFVTTSGGDLTVGAALTGSMNLVKSGAGALVMTNTSASNNFAGGIYLNAGMLRIGADTNLGVNTGAGNDLFFNGGTLQTTAGITVGSGRVLNFNGAGGTLDVGGALTFASNNQLAGAASLTKTGAASMVIAGTNTFSGPVTLQQGTIQLSTTNALGSPGAKSTITLAPSTLLDLRSDAATSNFGNDVIVQNNTPATPATINTNTISAPTGGVFQLGGLNIGDATLATGGNGGSLEFAGIVTVKGAARFDTGRNLLFSDRVTGGGSITKLGSGTLTFGSGPTDTTANTYTGITNIAGGVIQLNKAAGTTAIPGDVALSGGTLVLLQPRQIADNSALVLSGGTFDLGGQSDAVSTLNNSGATVVVNAATLTVGNTSISGGTTTIGATPVGPRGTGGGIQDNPNNAVSSVNSNYTTDTMTVSDGAVIVNPGGSLNIGAGGLFFSGAAAPAITLVSDSVTPGRVALTGDVTNNCTAGTASIVSTGVTPIAGTIELGDAQRIFTVPSASSDLSITGRLSKGGLRKSGAGKLILTSAGDYALGTLVVSGILEARDGALGIGPVTLGGGNLNLRSDQAVSRFGNDLTTSDATLDIGRVTAGTTGTLQMSRLSIGASRLRVTGASGGTLEFTGTANLTGTTAVVENYVGVLFSNAISGTGGLTKDTGGGTLTFGGSAPNTYTGITRVNAGTLQLNKPAGVAAVAGNLQVFTGGVVRWQGNEQVADLSTLAVNGSTSTMDLNGFSETVSGLAMTAGTVSTGVGNLRLAGNVSTSASAAVANITGNIDLGAVTRTFTVADGAPADDLIIAANVSGAGGINKAGAGSLLLAGNNSFTGGLTITAGSIRSTGGTTLSGATGLGVSSGSLDLPGALTTTSGAVVTKTGAGSVTIRGPQTNGAGAQLIVQQGAVNLNTDAGTTASHTLSVSATGGTVTMNSNQHLAALNVGAGAVVAMGAGNHLLYTDSLTASNAGKLDLGDNDLVIGSGQVGAWNGTAYTGLTGLLASGRNGGAWNGNGIATSLANSGTLTTLGIASAVDVLGGAGTFAGQSVPASAILISYTYGGDANLDGKINVDDYTRIDFNVPLGGTVAGFSNGDFNYDGKINVDDYTIIDFNVGIQGVRLGGAAVAQQFAQATRMQPTGAQATPLADLPGVTAVPEPVSLAPILLGAGALVRRRRRRSSPALIAPTGV